nr:hypothetical protein BaRGS_026848 [Batillaria attramentaria]
MASMYRETFPARSYPDLRYLDASTSGMTLNDLDENSYLVRLSLSACGLMTLSTVTLPNLRWLDLSANALISVNMQTFASMRNLRALSLSDNPLTSLTNSGADWSQQRLHTLDLSLTKLDTYNGRVLATFPNVRSLNISHGALTTITTDGFFTTPDLQELDVRQSPLEEFPRHLLTRLTSLDFVYASNFKLCCPAVIPKNLNPNNCHAPVDEISSCDDLLRSSAYRACLWVMGALTIIGNVGCFAARILQKEAAKTGFHVFVTNLTLADFIMGVYLAIIGAADLVYSGKYLWNDKLWKGSVACSAAGFLSLLSSEVSAFFICLITLDRFLVLRFPFSAIRFRPRSAMVASAVLWVLGFVLAFVPLLPVTSEWEFYSQTGICVPLPITRRSFKGQRYSFGVIVVFNFVLFILIASGQVLIFAAVRKNSISKSNQDNQDATIARRLTTIVLSDFLCWFPIGLLGLLASAGIPISSEVNIGMAIFILPCNSALNPFLYTFNVFMEKRRKAAEARLLQQLIRKAGTLTTDTVQAKTRTKMLCGTQTQSDDSQSRDSDHGYGPSKDADQDVV